MKQLLALLTVLALTTAFAADSEEGFKPIFNGKDLTGWNQVGKEKWTVENGVIHCKAVTKEYGYLQTDKDYKDFQMTLRFKCVGDGNTGIFASEKIVAAASIVSRGNEENTNTGLP